MAGRRAVCRAERRRCGSSTAAGPRRYAGRELSKSVRAAESGAGRVSERQIQTASAADRRPSGDRAAVNHRRRAGLAPSPEEEAAYPAPSPEEEAAGRRSARPAAELAILLPRKICGLGDAGR